jgi:hypothetical protein
MRTPDKVLEELWAIKDAELQQAGGDGKQLVALLRAQSQALREGLQLKTLMAAVARPQPPFGKTTKQP